MNKIGPHRQNRLKSQTESQENDSKTHIGRFWG